MKRLVSLEHELWPGRRGSWLTSTLLFVAVIGSLHCTPVTSRLLVDTIVDLADSTPGDGACLTEAGNCSLRAAIQEANARGGHQEIQLPEGFYLLGLEGMDEEQSATGDLDVYGDLALRSLGDAVHTVVDAQGIDRVFHVHTGAHLLIERVMVEGGEVAGVESNGGGIYVEDGAKLNLDHAMVNGNSAAGNGGGIYNLGETVVLRSTISHNHSDAAGGGLFNDADLALSMSTVSTNEAATDGGGLGQSDATNTIVGNVTFTLNSAPNGGALDSRHGSLSMVNTILANSPSGDNCTAGAITSGGHNLSSDESCELAGTGDMTSTNPLLSGLHSFADKGLPVHVLLEGSPAIDAGDDTAVDTPRGDQLDLVPSRIQIGAVVNPGPLVGLFGKLYVPSVTTGGPGGEVRIFSTLNHSLITTLTLGDILAAEVSPYGNVLYLARGRYNDDTVPNELYAYKLPGLTHMWTVPLPGVPSAVAASGSALKVFVVGSNMALNTGYVTYVNVATAVSSSLTGLDLAPLFLDGDLGSTSSLLFLTGDASGSGSEEIRIYSTTTQSLLAPALIPSGSFAGGIAPGVYPSRMYINGFSPNIIMLTGWFPGTTPIGTLPKTVSGGGVAVHPDGNRVYASDLTNLDVIDVGAGSVITTLGVGGYSLTVHPGGQWLYVGGPYSTVSVVNCFSNLVTTTLPVPSGQHVSKMAVQP